MRHPKGGASHQADQAVALALVAMERHRNEMLSEELAVSARCCLMGTLEVGAEEGSEQILILASAGAALLGLPVLLLSEHASRVAHLHEVHSFYFSSLGLSLGMVSEKSSKESRRKEYGANVVIATTPQAANDYMLDTLLDGGDQTDLRIQLEALLKPTASRQRYMHTAPGVLLLDGAKRQMLDLAQSPITISGGDGHLWTREILKTAHLLARELVVGEHYEVLATEPFILLTESGRQFLVDQSNRLPEIWQSSRLREELVTDVLLVRDVLKLGADYDVGPSGLVLKRAYTEPGLPSLNRERLQLLKIENGFGDGQDPETLSRISIPGFFSRFEVIGGIAGVGKQLPGLIWRHYGVLQRDRFWGDRGHYRDAQCYIYSSGVERLAAAVERVVQLLDEGRQVMLPVHSRDLYSQLEAAFEGQLSSLEQAPQPGTRVFATGRGEGKLYLLPLPLLEKVQAGLAQEVSWSLLIADAPSNFELPALDWVSCLSEGDSMPQVYLCLEDGLLVEGLPLTIRTWLGRRAASGEPWEGVVASQVLARCQYFQRKSVAQRLQELQKMDLNYSKLLAFAGI